MVIVVSLGLNESHIENMIQILQKLTIRDVMAGINDGIDCLKNQENNPSYKSPDYKFKNDNEDRDLSKFF